MPEKTTLRKLNSAQVEKLKGKLIEVKRVGAGPVFVECAKSNTVNECLKKADVPLDSGSELKIEAKKTASSKWETVTLSTKVFAYSVIAITTKVEGN